MAINWSKIFQKNKGRWVAFKSDEKTVIASGKTAKEVWEKARRTGYAKPVLTKMPKGLVTHVGTSL